MSAPAAEPTHSFCIHTTAARYGCSSEEVAQWLQRGGYGISANRPAQFTAAAHQRLLEFLAQGAACRFDCSTLPAEQELRHQKKALGRELYRLHTSRAAKKQLIKYYRQQVQASSPDQFQPDKSVLKSQFVAISQQLSQLTAQLVTGEEWDRISTEVLRLQRDKTALRYALQQASDPGFSAKLAKTEEELLAVMAELQRVTTAHSTVSQQIASIAQRQQETRAANLLALAPSDTASNCLHDNSLQQAAAVLSSIAAQRTAEIPWADVQFDDGALLIRYGGLWLPRFRFPEARRSLNLIRQHYIFRQAPPLQVRLHQHTVLEVLNREVVLYYFQFLSNTGLLLDIPTEAVTENVGQRFARCTKQYYRTHLPNLFRKQSLLFLCERMDEETCIIPTPELVINSAGTRAIHDSFLFTYLSKFSACIVWESTEEGKATYVFKVGRATYRHSLQTIYNYIVNDTPNKRSTLIKSPALQRHLGMAAWLPHTTYAEWKRQLRPSLDFHATPIRLPSGR